LIKICSSSISHLVSPLLDCFCVYAHNQLCDSEQKYIKVLHNIDLRTEQKLCDAPTIRTKQEIRKRLVNFEDEMLNSGPFTEFEIIARKAAKQAFEWVQEGDREPKNVLSERETISIGRKRVMCRGRERQRCGRRGLFPVTLGTIPAIASFTPNPLRNLESVFVELRNLKLSSL